MTESTAQPTENKHLERMRLKRTLIAPSAPSSQRWMVSYADFLTLLFALFVMLYSISSINEDKYRQLVSKFSGALNLSSGGGVPEVIVKEKIVKVVETKEVKVAVPTDGIAVNLKKSAREEGTLDPVVIGFQPLLKMGKDKLNGVGVALHVGEGWVELTMPAALVFRGESTDISKDGMQILDEVAEVLKGANYAINIENFYHTETGGAGSPWSSSWELTSVRSAQLVNELGIRGVDPTLMMASGYGSYYPVATNQDPQGQNMNSRINIWIGFYDELRSRVLQLKQFELSPEAVDQSKPVNP